MVDKEEAAEYLPRDVKIMKSLLKSMGVQDYEPRIVHQFLELWYRYVVDVLTDAQVYSEHASKPGINSDDVKLAIQTKVNCSFSQPPPREVILVALLRIISQRCIKILEVKESGRFSVSTFPINYGIRNVENTLGRDWKQYNFIVHKRIYPSKASKVCIVDDEGIMHLLCFYRQNDS